ncbi:putative nuclease HARBI1 [Strongylocentrotus purpuratus]|uniref:Putative nuclease HARBI1 n=1 Tax=Strongylocentrotus purpuratus TaxID=7668 RepID=A0A7M7PC67_STRPU|nr:putative nuclease HARBI1 [Strongylocentrotus purpuratus]
MSTLQLHIYNDYEFVKRYRLSKRTTLLVIDDIADNLRRLRSDGIPVHIQLLTVLRFYAVGSFQLLHGDEIGLSQPTLSKLIADVSSQLAAWRRRYIHFPDQLHGIQQAFYDYSNFPGVIGAIDCTHVPIQNPGGEFGQTFINRKSRSSINVQAVCSFDGTLTNIVARWPGGTHDSRIFRESALKQRLEQESHEPRWLLGDSGYASQPFLMTPLLHPGTASEERYNRAHKRGRNVIERTFGRMKRRFPCLNGLRLKLQTTLTVIVAVAVLWNISIQHGDPEVDGEVLPEILGDHLPPPGANNLEGQLRRQNLIREHFA